MEGDAEKEKKLSALDRWSWIWSPKRSRIGAIAILGPDGTALCGDHAASELRRHWQPLFQGSGIDDAEADLLLAHAQTCPDHIDWAISYNDFLNIIPMKKDTCPGPDGILFSAYRAAGDSVSCRWYAVLP